jgi:hypothetical protein
VEGATVNQQAVTLVGRLGRVYGLRVIVKYGLDRFLRDAVLVAYFASLIWMATVAQPDLLDPTTIGSDTSNYYAAGLRLNAGHPLYVQGPGDRPVPIDPPYFSVPLLSPPLIAVVWRPLALLPGTAVMYAWWLGGFVAMTAATVWMSVHGSVLRNAGMLVIAPWLALTALSGNLNAYLAVMLVVSWWTCARGRSGASGALIAVAAALKVTPLLYLPWILVRRDRAGLGGFIVAAAACALVSLLGAGFDNHLAYLDVVRTTGTVGLTPNSVPGILLGLGAPHGLADLAIPAIVVGGTLAVFVLRRRSGPAFSVATLMSVFATPSLGVHSLSLLLPAVAPYPEAKPLASEALDGVAQTRPADA